MRSRILAPALVAVALMLAPPGHAAESIASPNVVAPTDPRIGDTQNSAASVGLEDLLGMVVLGPQGERLGQVDDVLVDELGQPSEVVVSDAGGGSAKLAATRLILSGRDALRLGDR